MSFGFCSPIFSDRLKELYRLKGINADNEKNRGWSIQVAQNMFAENIIDINDFKPSLDDYGKDITKKKKIDDISRNLRKHLALSDAPEKVWLIRYCKYFNCSADYLLGFIENPTHEITDIRKQIGLSVDAITKLQAITQEWSKVYFPYGTFEEDYKLYKSIPYSNNTDYEKFLSSLDPLTRIKVKEFMHHTTTPAPSIEILSKIITHQLFDTFMQTIVECQNDYNNLQNQLDKLEDSKNQYEDFLKKNPDITPFDDSFDNIYSIMSNDEEKTKSLLHIPLQR